MHSHQHSLKRSRHHQMKAAKQSIARTIIDKEARRWHVSKATHALYKVQSHDIRADGLRMSADTRTRLRL